MRILFSPLLLALMCSLPVRAAEPVVVHLGSFSKAVDYAPYFVAKQKHLFENALKSCNARPTFEEFQSLPSINESFASKKLDAVLEAPCIVGKASGMDLQILGVSALVDFIPYQRRSPGKEPTSTWRR